MSKKVKETKENVAPAESEITPEQALKEQRKKDAAALRKSLNEAKNTLHDFMKTEVYTALDEAVQNAIKRLAKKATSTTGKSTTLGFLKGLFPEVGFKLNEFELFKAERMGRSEMRKKVHYGLKKCDPADRMWIRFVEDEESWVLDQIGGECPDNWTDADRPVTRAKA